MGIFGPFLYYSKSKLYRDSYGMLMELKKIKLNSELKMICKYR